MHFGEVPVGGLCPIEMWISTLQDRRDIMANPNRERERIVDLVNAVVMRSRGGYQRLREMPAYERLASDVLMSQSIGGHFKGWKRIRMFG